MAKGGSKVLTAVISFLLGFIFAILVEVGAVFGVYYYVTSTDLDTLMSKVGLQNRDENGDNVYINTDPNDGGASNVGELLSLLKGYLYSEGSSSMDFPVLGNSIDDIQNLFPVTQQLLAEKLYPVVSQYVDVDWTTFESKSISELPQFLSDCLLDVRPAVILSKFGMEGLVGEDAMPVIRALLAGAEFDYARTDADLKFPVYYDTYTYNQSLGTYYREESVDGQQAYPDTFDEDFLYQTATVNADNKTVYRLYYIPCKTDGGVLDDADFAEEDGEGFYAENTVYVAVKPEDGAFYFDVEAFTANPQKYLYRDSYGSHPMGMTGNYYYTNGGTEVQVNPVTIRSFTDSEEVLQPLYSVSVIELMGGESDNNKIIGEIFGTTSVGELIHGEVDFNELIGNLECASVINIDPEQPLLAYIGYGLSNVSAAPADAGYQYVGYATIDGVSTKCYIASELKASDGSTERVISEVWYYNDALEKVDLPGTTFSQVGNLANEMEITALVKVKASDAVLSYIGYGLTSVRAEAGEGYTHVGSYNDGTSDYECFIATDADGDITEVWYYDGATKTSLQGTVIDGVSARIASLVDDLTLPDVVEVDIDDNIMVYMGYGLTNVSEATTGEDYTHYAHCKVDGVIKSCYVQAETLEDGSYGKILSVWYEEGAERVYISGTKISGVSVRVQSLSEDLTIGDVVDVTEDDSILYALKDTPIASIGTEVKNLTLGDILSDEDIGDSLILQQLKNADIGNLSAEIDKISVQSIYISNVYAVASDDADPELATVYQQGVLYYEKQEDGSFVYVNDADKGDDRGRLTETQFNDGVAAGKSYYTYGTAQGMWKLILFKGGAEKVYTLNNLHNMIQESTANIYGATLGELQEAGIIDAAADLNKTLNWVEDGQPKSAVLADMSLKNLINAVISLSS